ncbi:MAG: SRPBCC family protein [Acidimicrobiales bacterium]
MNDDQFEPSPLADVEFRTTGTRATLVFVRQLRHSPAKVWAALTDPAQLPQWAPFTADRDLGQLGTTTLTKTDGQDPATAALPAQVTHCEPPTLLEYTWGDDVLRWQLEANEGGTLLTLLHTTDDPTMVPKVAAGWHLCLDVAERLLDGRPVGPIVGAAAMDHGWPALHDAYAAALSIAD